MEKGKKAERIVIIGAIAAGTCAAAKIRRKDEEAQIVLYEKDQYISYATCGLPYFISDQIKKVSSLLINDVAGFEKRFHVSVNVMHEVIHIEPEKKTVTVKDLKTGKEFMDRYDKLLICTGSHVINFNSNCIDEERIFSLKTLHDAIRIKEYLAGSDKKNGKAIIVGGGFIGLELLDALIDHGFEIIILEKMEQILGQFDMEIIAYVQNYLMEKGIKIITGEELTDIYAEDELVKCINIKNEISQADMVFMGIGVKPESALAANAGVLIGPSGGIKTDKNLKTNIKDIYAAGDCVECENILTGEEKLYYLANIASRQGRAAALNICGVTKDFIGALPSSIIKVLDIAVAKTGLGIKDCKRLGIDYDIIEGHFFSHASYYPGAQMIHMILIYNKKDGRILGFEAVGKKDIDKKTDIIATSIKAGLKVWDLADIDFCYQPAFGSAKDPINMLGLIGENIFNKEVAFISSEGLREKMHNREDFKLIDVRSKSEYDHGFIEGAILMPIDSFREISNTLDKKDEIIIYCRSSYRAYLAYRILDNRGFKNIKCLNGSYLSWIRKI